MSAYKTLSQKGDEGPVLTIERDDSSFSPNTTDDQNIENNINEPKVPQ